MPNTAKLTHEKPSITTLTELYLDSKLPCIRKGIVLEDPKLYKYSQKDPTIAFDPRTHIWHLYFTNCEPRGFSIGHLTTTELSEEWQ